MSSPGAQPSQQVGNLYIICEKKLETTFENLVLVFLPGKQIRNKSNKEKDRQHQADGTGNFMSTFILYQLLNLDGLFFFGLQFIRVWRLAFFLFQLICHEDKDKY